MTSRRRPLRTRPADLVDGATVAGGAGDKAALGGICCGAVFRTGGVGFVAGAGARVTTTGCGAGRGATGTGAGAGVTGATGGGGVGGTGFGRRGASGEREAQTGSSARAQNGPVGVVDPPRPLTVADAQVALAAFWELHSYCQELCWV